MMGSSTDILRRDHKFLRVAAASDDEEEHEPTCRRRRRELPELSEDVLMDILVRLPIKNLMRCKSVSRLWYNLITSPYFVSAFEAANKNPQEGVTIYSKSLSSPPNRTDTNPIIAIGFYDDDVPVELPLPPDASFLRIVGCSAGLVCFSFSNQRDKFAIWNPATRHFRLIPPIISDTDDDDRVLSYKSRSCGFCFDPIANAPKITRLTIFRGETYFEANQRVQLNEFTLQGSNSSSWKEEKTIFIPFHVGFIYLGLCFTCVNKYLFWISHSTLDKYILCYDMVAQIFTRIELPFPDCNCLGTRMTVYKETLAIFYRKTGPPFDIWVLNDNKSWSLQRIRTPSKSSEPLFPIAFFTKDGAGLWLMRTRSGDCLWDPHTGDTVKNLGKTQPLSGYPTYTQSLPSVTLLASRSSSCKI